MVRAEPPPERKEISNSEGVIEVSVQIEPTLTNSDRYCAYIQQR